MEDPKEDPKEDHKEDPKEGVCMGVHGYALVCMGLIFIMLTGD